MAKTSDKAKGGGFDQDQQIKFLKKIEFFNNFDDHELKQFLTVSRWLKVTKGTLIIQENTMERVFYILVKGEVSVVKTVAGKKKPVHLTSLSSGACFGEMSLVMDVKRTAGVIASSECFILMVEPGIINSSNVFLQLKFYKRFCEIMVSRLILANERVASQEKAAAPQKDKADTAPFDDELDEETEIPGAQAPPPSPSQDAPPPPSPETKNLQDLDEDSVVVLPPLPPKKDRIVKKKLQRLVKNTQELPYNHAVGKRISPHLAGECENTRMFADLIHLDPVLSAKVLQVANSSFFRRSTPVATVAHALITVGIKQIQEALDQTLNSSAKLVPFSGYKNITLSFWRHSIVVARISTLLKDIIRVNLSTDIYLAALLHDLGILALDPLEPNYYPHLIDPNAKIKKSPIEAEIEHIGIDHGTAGGWFAESAGLPTPYIDVMNFHHQPENAKENPLLVALVHLADLFATERGMAVGGSGYEVNPLTSFAWIIIQDQHRPFLDVNVPDFINSFNAELDKTWSGIMDGLDF